MHYVVGKALLICALTAGLASAGNIVLTGHDDDLHQTAQATAQAKGMFAFARNGSTLPVLTFDAGSQLTSLLASLSIPFTNINPNTASNVTDALFDPALYSAFAVASDTSCGGCDNSPAGEANIAAHAAAIGAFLNAGRGIVGFAGASSANYYAFVPQAASSVGGAPTFGYSATAVGTTYGIPAVDGDATHNLFWNPGTHGESAFYQIAETNSSGSASVPGPAAVTLICNACTVSGGVIGGTAPEPATYLFMAGGLAGLAFLRKVRTSVR